MRIPIRVLLAICCYCLPGLGATSASTPSSVVTLKGSARTVCDYSSTITVHVPVGVENLVVNVPMPKDVALSGWSQNIDSVVVKSSPAATRITTISDPTGNSYRAVEFDTPASGDVVITLNVNSVVVITDMDRSLPSAGYPLSYIPDEILPYLKPSSLVESDDPQIAQTGKALVSGAKDEASATQAIAAWVFGNVSFSLKAPSVLDAIGTYKARVAQCRGYAYLFCALARAAGIPARCVSGYTIESQMDVPAAPGSSQHVTIKLTNTPHAWVEVWYPVADWIPYDPQMTAGFVDPHHLLGAVGRPGDDEQPLVEWHITALTGRNLTYDQKPKLGNIVDFFGFEYASGDVTNTHVLLQRAIEPIAVAASPSAFAR